MHRITHLSSVATDKRRLSDLEELYKAAGYVVRYERGHFRAGHCLVHERRVVVVNRFFDTTARIQKLSDLAAELDFTKAQLTEVQQVLLKKLQTKVPSTDS